MKDLAEEAFQRWKEENKNVLLKHCPATVGFNGAANNFSHWCRKVYTGEIRGILVAPLEAAKK